MNPQEPATITCPHCWETYEILIDITGSDSTLIQDCEVCCNPMEIRYEIQDGGTIEVQVGLTGQ